MASAEAIAVEHHSEQVKLSNLAAYRVQALWGMVDPSSISDSWAALLPRAVQTVSTLQLVAASQSNSYIKSVLAAQDVEDDGEDVVPSSLAGIASDGRSLAGLLASPAYTALDAISNGVSVDRAMAAGLNDALMLASSSVTDAGRVADGIGIATRRTVTGYIRQTSGKCCSRCAVLAGRFYKWNTGFLRHPQCACIHVPASESVSGGSKRTDPYKYFQSLSPAEQDKRFTKAGAQAIRDGADMNQVVNARRGMSTTAGGSKVTTEGTGKRGYYRSLGGSKQRMMPEEIYKRANSRDDAIRMLQQYGYITPGGQTLAAIRGEGYGFAADLKRF